MNKIIAIAAAAVLAASCSAASGTLTARKSFPSVTQQGKTAIVAHRGFWNCDAGGFSENSIASLKAAQDCGFWGSEFDIQLTADNVVIVNHNDDIDGLKIAKNDWATLSTHLLPNGERRPLLEEYLRQGAVSKGTILVCEFKKQSTEERDDILVEKTIAAIKKAGLLKPSRIAFISFSRHICEKIAAEQPEFINQYLGGEIAPAELSSLGINGWDYHHGIVSLHNGWVDDAHALGMSTNVWTVDKENQIRRMAELGVDAITSNEPLLVREILGERECTR